MEIFIYLFFILINFINIKIIQPKIRPKKALKYLGLFLLAIIFCAMVISISLNANDMYQNSIFFLSYVSFVILISVSIINQLSFIIIDYVILFHLKNNKNNLDRNPIKFLVNNQVKLKKIFTILWIINCTIMITGLWFG